MKCLDVVKEDMQEVGAREDEVFGCGEGGHAGGRSERRLRVSAGVTPDGKSRKKKYTVVSVVD